MTKHYFKKKLTCDEKENWKIYESMKKERLKIIKSATDNIKTTKSFGSEEQLVMVQVWEKLIKREEAAIQNDRKRVLKIIDACKKIRVIEEKGKLFKNMIKTSKIETTCDDANINELTNKVIATRKAVIESAKIKLVKEQDLLKATKDPKKIEKMRKSVETFKKTIAGQLAHIADDKKRIKMLINQCKNVNKYTIERKKVFTGVTCNPVELRDRVQKIMNGVFKTITTAQKKISDLQIALAKAKNDKERAVINAEISATHVLINSRKQQVITEKNSLKKMSAVCAQYDYHIRTNVYLKKYTEAVRNVKISHKEYKNAIKEVTRTEITTFIEHKFTRATPEQTC